MSFGLNIFNAVGGLTYSSTDVTWNQVDFFQVAAAGDVTKTYPVLSGREVLTVQMFVNAPPTDQKATAHTVTTTGTSVRVKDGSEASYIMVLMR